MKEFKSVLVLISILILVLLIEFHFKIALNTGDVSFIFLNGKNDSFAIVTNVDLPKNTIIRFTDSEWNGNRFGKDESDISWNTGNEIIKIGTIINFVDLSSSPKVSIGTLKGTMRISIYNDAVFAYVGRL